MPNSKRKKYVSFDTTTGKISFFDDWESCKKAVLGIPSIVYRSFTKLSDAEIYAEQLTERVVRKREQTDIAIYVDGSFQEHSNRASWAWVMVGKENNIIKKKAGICRQEAMSRNIDGELAASLSSAKWATKKKIKATIFYDYQGIESWALGDWRAKTKVAILYQEEIQKYLSYVNFQKIKAHSGIRWNEYVDQLAKSMFNSRLEKRFF